MAKEQKIKYVKHPVSPEEKAKLRADGFTIIDAAYEPAGEAKPERKQKQTLTLPKADK